MKVYISGPITGTTEYRERFRVAESLLRAAGHIPMNPVEILNMPEDTAWADYMKIDLQILDLCDGIYMLNGWQESKGASIEFEKAYESKMLIMFEGGAVL